MHDAWLLIGKVVVAAAPASTLHKPRRCRHFDVEVGNGRLAGFQRHILLLHRHAFVNEPELAVHGLVGGEFCRHPQYFAVNARATTAERQDGCLGMGRAGDRE